jgi:hypothetical protein
MMVHVYEDLAAVSERKKKSLNPTPPRPIHAPFSLMGKEEWPFVNIRTLQTCHWMTRKREMVNKRVDKKGISPSFIVFSFFSIHTFQSRCFR